MSALLTRMANRAGAAAHGTRLAFRALLNGALQLARQVQLVQADGLAGEQLPGAELMQHYGFTSAPPAGSEGIALPLGGRSSHTVIVATEHGSVRKRLQARGEVAIYTEFGTFVHLKADGQISIRAATQLHIEAPAVRITGDLQVEGDITDRIASGGRSMAGMRAIYNDHRHGENDSGGPTEPPATEM